MKFKITFLSLLTTLVFRSLLSQTYHPGDSLALLAIDAACDVNNQLDWNTETDPNLWDGISWDGSTPKRVREISVDSKGLEGALDVSDLDSLIYIFGESNSFTDLIVPDHSVLQTLYLNYNQLDDLDVSNLLNVETLSIAGNNFTIFDPSALINLRALMCSYNQLSELDLSNMDSLRALSCIDNNIEDLDLSACTKLISLSCDGNPLGELDLSSTPDLYSLGCNECQLDTLDVSHLYNLTFFGCTYNNISKLDISNLVELIQLRCHHNQIDTLDVKNLTNLQHLECSANKIARLDVGNLVNLTILYCNNNLIDSLNVINLANMKDLDCSMNQLTQCDVSNMTQLNYFWCSRNQIANLDLSNNEFLILLFCSHNPLESIDLSNLSVLEAIICDSALLTCLDISELENLKNLSCTLNKIPFSCLPVDSGIDYYNYSPMLPLYDTMTFDSNILLDYSSEALVDETVTTFYFYKNDLPADTNTTGLFTTNGSGEYYCRMKNAKFPDLTQITSAITIIGVTAPELAVSETDLDVDYAANSTATFDVTSNIAWTIANIPAWLSLSSASGSGDETITVTAQANTSNDARSATLTVSGAGVDTVHVAVTQAGLPVSGINELLKGNVRFYPNPVYDQLKIQLTSNDLPATIRIYSPEGKQLMLKETNSSLTEMEMSDLQAGIYILEIITSIQTIEERIIKQ